MGRGGVGGEEHLMVNRTGECRKREDEGMEWLGERNINEGIIWCQTENRECTKN